MTSITSKKIAKKRQGIDNITRLQICNFVASRPTPPSTKVVREWAESTFGRKFPQSTLSTLLRSNGLQIKQVGGRGRRCRPQDSSADADISSQKKKAEQKSEKTNLLLSHLKLLADGRCRGRSSDHPEIELAFLEETYLMLRNKKKKITISWFHQLARQLFKEKNEPFPKNISQFLNQIYDKYFLANVVYKHLFAQLPYDSMLTKLSVMFPELAPSSPSPPQPPTQQLTQPSTQHPPVVPAQQPYLQHQPHPPQPKREFRPLPHYATRTASIDHNNYPESNLRSGIKDEPSDTSSVSTQDEDTQEVSQQLGHNLADAAAIPTLSMLSMPGNQPPPQQHVYAIPSTSPQHRLIPQPHLPKPESFSLPGGPAAHISFSVMSSFTEYQNGLDGDYNMLMDNVYIQ